MHIPNKHKVVVIIVSIVICMSLVVLWNHNVQPVPDSVYLSKIAPGRTTVAEAKIILGSTKTMHNCSGSVLYRFIPASSVKYGREIEISLYYKGPNSGMHSGDYIDVPDDNSIVQRVAIEVYPRFDSGSKNPLESWVALLLDWEYYTVKKWI